LAINWEASKTPALASQEDLSHEALFVTKDIIPKHLSDMAEEILCLMQQASHLAGATGRASVNALNPKNPLGHNYNQPDRRTFA
jgi:hypothetical protein